MLTQSCNMSNLSQLTFHLAWKIHWFESCCGTWRRQVSDKDGKYWNPVQWDTGLTICQGSSKIILLNREYCYTGVLPHTFYCNFR